MKPGEKGRKTNIPVQNIFSDRLTVSFMLASSDRRVVGVFSSWQFVLKSVSITGS